MFRNTMLTRLIAALFISLLLPLTASAQATDRRVGEWQQFVLTDEGSWRLLGTYVVQQRDGLFAMAPVTQTRDSAITNSRGLFDVKFTASEWTFSSDWGNGNIGVFRLAKVDPGVYQGWAYLGEKRMNRNLWVLAK